MGRAITYNGHTGKHLGNYIRGALITLLGLSAAGGIYKGIEALINTTDSKVAKHEIRMKNPNEFRNVAVEEGMRIENVNNNGNKMATNNNSGTSGVSPKAPKEETYDGFTKNDFADLIEPEYRASVPNVHIIPEEVKRIKKLTPEQLAHLYYRDHETWGFSTKQLEDMSTLELAERFLKRNDYKGPGWLVWVMIDEDRSYGLMPASVFVNNEGRLVVHSSSNLDF